MTNVLAIEDDRDMASLLVRALRGAGMDVTVAPTGADGLDAAPRQQPDAILLDLDLPDVDGLDLIETLAPIAPVIVLSGRREDESVVTGLERGADDYVTKPFSPRQLVARIEAATRRRTGTRVIERGGLRIDVEARAVTLHEQPLDLTRRELDLLVHLAERAGRVASREEILAAVWNSSAEWQTVATVTEHVRRLRNKLGDPAWVESVRGVGYRLAVPGERAGRDRGHVDGGGGT